jgi:hypothetical protein
MYLLTNIPHKTISFFRHLARDPKMTMNRLRGYFQPTLLSFQMGKVGSQTIKYTLESDYHVIHMHTKEEMLAFLPNLRKSKTNKLEIITATRDPIGREISVYFQNICAPAFAYGVESMEEAFKVGTKGLVEKFHQRWNAGEPDTTVWFDEHFKACTGIDIYAYPFDREQGWQIIETDEYRILVVRFEDINRNYLEAVNTFVAPSRGGVLRYEKMINSNVSDDKWYGSLMNDFKSQISFKKEILDAAYQSKYCHHFYTDREIDKMRSRYQIDR